MYIAPNLTLDEFIPTPKSLVASHQNLVLIAGEPHAWTDDWGSRVSKARENVVLANTGGAISFSKQDMVSLIGLMFVSNTLFKGQIWWVSEEYTHNDH